MLFRGKNILTAKNSRKIELRQHLNPRVKSTELLIERLGFLAEVEDRKAKPSEVDYQMEFDKQMDSSSSIHKEWFQKQHYISEDMEVKPYGTIVDSSDEETKA